MSRSLAARIEKLEAESGSHLYGPIGGRQLAKLGGYEGAELERMAKFFSGQRARKHEEMVDAMLEVEKGGQP